MFEELLAAVRLGLELWNRADKVKYASRMNDLERDRLVELGKPRAKRSNRRLDWFDIELKKVAREWRAAVAAGADKGVPDAKP